MNKLKADYRLYCWQPINSLIVCQYGRIFYEFWCELERDRINKDPNRVAEVKYKTDLYYWPRNGRRERHRMCSVFVNQVAKDVRRGQLFN